MERVLREKKVEHASSGSNIPGTVRGHKRAPLGNTRYRLKLQISVSSSIQDRASSWPAPAGAGFYSCDRALTPLPGRAVTAPN
ncbi:hypothetical protein MJG53_006724 [Ovis ammon polii x Ovis aries]|uniref:Uncharacterized protein n=2 Tax=Ovis TaxID=9935 RepID=A0A836D2P4_SHEEP|nr:hypothetical protein JEQ12_015861 [Ovis aries]KAI4585190.1 hypothetical protein MJG53_006724 [Ovis ammon polii x Ovis aries]